MVYAKRFLCTKNKVKRVRYVCVRERVSEGLCVCVCVCVCVRARALVELPVSGSKRAQRVPDCPKGSLKGRLKAVPRLATFTEIRGTCVYERERERARARERERERERACECTWCVFIHVCACEGVCMCVCVKRTTSLLGALTSSKLKECLSHLRVTVIIRTH